MCVSHAALMLDVMSLSVGVVTTMCLDLRI